MSLDREICSRNVGLLENDFRVVRTDAVPKCYLKTAFLNKK
jgi:hypothetical protein